MPRRVAAPRISPYVLCCCSRRVPAAIATTVLTTLLQIDELMSGSARFIKTTNAPCPPLHSCPRRMKGGGGTCSAVKCKNILLSAGICFAFPWLSFL